MMSSKRASVTHRPQTREVHRNFNEIPLHEEPMHNILFSQRKKITFKVACRNTQELHHKNVATGNKTCILRVTGHWTTALNQQQMTKWKGCVLLLVCFEWILGILKIRHNGRRKSYQGDRPINGKKYLNNKIINKSLITKKETMT